MKLADLYQTLSTDERAALAKRAGMSDGYLYQLATRWRGKRASLAVIKALAESDKRLTVRDMVAEFMQDAPTAPEASEAA